MNVLMPMAGEGQRFKDKGFNLPKPMIPVSTGMSQQDPMFVRAALDLKVSRRSRFIFVARTHHLELGLQQEIANSFPNNHVITLDRLTEGGACTCLEAKEFIDNDQELIITACDNGLKFSPERLEELKSQYDALIFTFRQNQSVLENPAAYGWVEMESDTTVKSISCKVPISDSPMKDHAIVGSFWFKRGSDFVTAAETMIEKNDRVKNEFYVDQVFNHMPEGRKIGVAETQKYICWGTPQQYEDYESTVRYWRDFIQKEEWA